MSCSHDSRERRAMLTENPSGMVHSCARQLFKVKCDFETSIHVRCVAVGELKSLWPVAFPKSKVHAQVGWFESAKAADLLLVLEEWLARASESEVREY